VSKSFRDVLVLIGPALVVVSLLMLLPVLGTFWISFWRDLPFAPRRFAGLSHYLRLLGDSGFRQSFQFTILFALVSVALEMVLGTIVALVVHEKIPGRGLIRGIILIPWVVPGVIGARIWQLIYRYDIGLINSILNPLFGFSVNFLGSPSGAFFSLVLADVWRTTPFVAIIVLAGLQLPSRELYEQAAMDGAGLLRRFTTVTLPGLRPILIAALLFRTMDALRVFDTIYVITNGGPGGATHSLSLFAFKYYLTGDFGSGAAVSMLLFLIAFGAALIFIKLGRFSEQVL